MALLVEQPLHHAQEEVRADAELPKVALLFLTRGPMPTAAVWREFLTSAALIEPNPATAAAFDFVPEPGGSGRLVPPLFRGAHRRNGKLLSDVRRSMLGLSSRLAVTIGARSAVPPRRAGPAAGPWADGGGAGAGAGGRQLGMLQPTRMLLEPGELGNCSDLAAADGVDVIAAQALFSVYAHPSLNWSYCVGDLLHGYALAEEERVPVHWGQHSMVEAERQLLLAALEEPLNQRFVMLSDSCVPLYPPHVVWLQLMWEGVSRINACKGDNDYWKRGEDRWSDDMATELLGRAHWRKSSQWAALSRKHAQVVAADDTVHEIFKYHCYTYYPGLNSLPDWMNETELQSRNCISDEHYIPTLLAMNGLDEETDCLGAVTHTEWRANSWSPKTYRPMQITYYIMRKFRRAWFSDAECGAKAAMDSAASLFRRKGRSASLQLERSEASAALPPPPPNGSFSKYLPVQLHSEFQPLDHSCSLFARKFDSAGTEPLLKLARDCDYGLGFSTQCVVGPGPVVPEAERVAAFQKEMLQWMHDMAAGRHRSLAASAERGHASHEGPSSDDDDADASPHFEYWHDPAAQHGIPIPEWLLQEEAPAAEQPEAINLDDFLPLDWPAS